MLITAFVVILILVALYGYFSSIKMTPLEKDIRKQGVDYECYECKKKFSVDEERCPDCYLITLYGQRKKILENNTHYSFFWIYDCKIFKFWIV